MKSLPTDRSIWISEDNLSWGLNSESSHISAKPGVLKSALAPIQIVWLKSTIWHINATNYLCGPYTVWLDIPTRILQNVLYSITLGSQILSPPEPAFWMSSFPQNVTGYVVWHVRQFLTILFTASSNTTSRNVRNTEHTLIKNSMLIFSLYEYFCFELWLIKH